MQNEVANPGTFVDRTKAFLNPENIGQKLRDSKDTIIYMILYGMAGFLVGYLFKRYVTVIIIFGLGCAFVVALSYLGLLNMAIDWSKVYSVLGIQQSDVSTDTMFGALFGWVRANTAISVALALGFFFGLRSA